MFKKKSKLEELKDELAKGTHTAMVITSVTSQTRDRTVYVSLCSNISCRGVAVTLILPKKDYDKELFKKGEAFTCYFPPGPLMSALSLRAVRSAYGAYFIPWEVKVDDY